MKKIYKSLLFAVIATLPFLTSCKDDNDSNPTLTVPESFVLNTPEFAANNVYDIPATSTVNLTTTQPDYGGWPAAVTYAVQISLDPTNEAGWKELSTTYTSTKISISGSELNTAVLDMYRAAHDEADPEGVMPLYFRLRAFLADSGKHFGEVFSNAVSTNVLSYDVPSDVVLPEKIFVCGGSIGTAWKTWKPLAPVYDEAKKGRFYTMVYNAADGFKWGFKEEGWLGYDDIDEIVNKVDGMTISNDGGNIKFDKAGWYVLKFVAKISGNKLKVTMTVSPGIAKVTGAGVAATDWAADAKEMTAPDSKDGDWIFNEFTGSGELRAFIEVPDEDWWRTEFTLYAKKTIYYRDFDIFPDWKGAAAEKAKPAKEDPENYSIQVAPGMTLKLNFDNNTGSIE